MILKSLTDCEAESQNDSLPFGYALKPLGFTLVLRADGSGCRLQSNYGEERRAPEMPIPNLARTVKPAPFLGCDNAAYVLGLGKSTDKPEKTRVKHELFVELTNEFSQTAESCAAMAYLAWVEHGQPGLNQAVDGLESGLRTRLDLDAIGIAVEGRSGCLHDSRSAMEFWAERAKLDKSDGVESVCLVCGRVGPTVTTLPQSLIGQLIPGATQANVALASVNFTSASRGASGIGLRSAPICADCASKAVQNFNALAASEKHSWGGMGDGTGLVWWTNSRSFDPYAANTFEPDPAWVANLLDAARSGRSNVRGVADMGHFYALTYSGNVARFVIRRYIELPTTDLRRNVTAWFDDVESPNRSRRFFRLVAYASSLGPMRRERGKWKTPSPVGVAEVLVHVALAGDPVPSNYLHLALSRAKAEIRLTKSDDGRTAGLARRRMEARAGLLRLILNRSVLKENPMSAHLDESRDDKAYVSGRLFAVSESLQHAAVRNVNASIADKYFEKALANPASVVATLTILSQQHLSALRRRGQTGAWSRYDREIRELNAQRGDAPARLSAEEQAAWVCGYYQQRLHDIETAIARSEAKKLAEGANSASDQDAPETGEN